MLGMRDCDSMKHLSHSTNTSLLRHLEFLRSIAFYSFWMGARFVNCRKTVKALVAAAALSAVMGTAHAEAVGMKISEWMYQGAGDTSREFIEFTNYGPVAIDMTGWSFDDASNTAGSLFLSSFGVVNPGESVILAEQAAADFRAA
jgi:Lamin Tail Domain